MRAANLTTPIEVHMSINQFFIGPKNLHIVQVLEVTLNNVREWLGDKLHTYKLQEEQEIELDE